MNAAAQLDRRVAVAALLESRGRLLVVSGLGGTTWDVAAVGDHDLNFYLWGAMGLAVSTGLGLALAQPDYHVLVVTGDGEMLMGMGSLATVAVQQPGNLSIAVIDNERYGETGEQETHTAKNTDLTAIARGAGIVDSQVLLTAEEVRAWADNFGQATAPRFSTIKVAAGNAPMVLPPRDGEMVTRRMRQELGNSS